jgi:hypothetical protein
MHWLETKARGKRQFIRLSVLRSLIFWAILVPVLGVANHPLLSSLRWEIYMGLILLPIFLLDGYLAGGWQWKDLEKKFLE